MKSNLWRNVLNMKWMKFTDETRGEKRIGEKREKRRGEKRITS